MGFYYFSCLCVSFRMKLWLGLGTQKVGEAIIGNGFKRFDCLENFKNKKNLREERGELGDIIILEPLHSGIVGFYILFLDIDILSFVSFSFC